MNNREKQKKLRQANIKLNLENQKGGRPSGRVRGGGVDSNPANLGGNKKDNKKKESSLNSRTHVMYKGKKVLKNSAMGKKAVAMQKRKSLASKNYMSKEMIEKRKKRLKIKK